jgi:hypothetical protein
LALIHSTFIIPDKDYPGNLAREDIILTHEPKDQFKCPDPTGCNLTFTDPQELLRHIKATCPDQKDRTLFWLHTLGYIEEPFLPQPDGQN